MSRLRRAPAAVLGLTVLGLALRAPVLHDSLFGDELSTYYIATSHSLGDVLHILHGHSVDLNPPLYFMLAWLSEKVFGEGAVALRLVSLIAGVAMIPMTYLLGRLTIGRRAGVLAAGLVALAPFAIFFSTEARPYALLAALVLGTAIALVIATTGRGRGWWVGYGMLSCAAVYTHFTAVFPLAALFVWAFVVHRESRRELLIATVLAAAAFAPWLPALIDNTHSVGASVIGFLQPFSAHLVLTTLGALTLGHPIVGLSAIPGSLAVGLVIAGVAVALAALPWARPALPSAGSALVLALALAPPVGIGIYSALRPSIWDARNLLTALPGFALCIASLLLGAAGSGGARAGIRSGSDRLRAAAALLASGLVLAGLAMGAARLLEREHRRPDYNAVVAQIARSSAPGDPIVDLGAVTPGPPTETEAALAFAGITGHPVIRIGLPPLAKVLAAAPYAALPSQSGETVAREATADARDGRIFLVMLGRVSPTVLAAHRRATGPIAGAGPYAILDAFLRALPARYRIASASVFSGFVPVSLFEFRAPRRSAAPRG